MFWPFCHGCLSGEYKHPTEDLFLYEFHYTIVVITQQEYKSTLSCIQHHQTVSKRATQCYNQLRYQVAIPLNCFAKTHFISEKSTFVLSILHLLHSSQSHLQIKLILEYQTC